MRAWRLFIQIPVLLLIAACGNYHEDYAGGDGANAFSTHGFKTLSFEAVKAIVFTPYCKQCHFASGGNKGNVNLETFANVAGHIIEMRADVTTNRMPEGSALPDFPKVVLLAWIKDGAKENSNTPLPDPNTKPPQPPPPAPPGFDKISSTILGPHCARCHTEISDYSFVMANLQKIKDDVQSNSMPKNEKPLADRYKKQLFAWIDAGAPKGFSDISAQLFVPYCIRCHSNFKNVKTVSSMIDEIQSYITQNKMPKNDDPVPDNIKALLGAWVKAGMPD